MAPEVAIALVLLTITNIIQMMDREQHNKLKERVEILENFMKNDYHL